MKLLIYIISFSFLFSDSCNVELIGHLTFGQGLSDLTGFAQDGREFAVVGLVQDLAAFVDITDPKNPFEIERISGSSSTWRDLKYWNRHVYIGADYPTESSDGVRVFSVDDPDDPQLIYTIKDFGNSHNIHIDSNGFLYVVGTLEHDLWIYDLSTPELPELIGTWDGEYLHDIEVYNNKVYGASIYSGNFYILDVIDKTNPKTLVKHYTGLDGVSTHDCAVTNDEKYLITGDETRGGHLKIWDISNYNNINLISEYMTDYQHSLHNIYIRPETNLVIMSYYVDGTRVLDISNPENPIEVGFYDTTNLTGLFDGNWGTYAYLPSGYIISSDRQNGLFILNSPLSDPELTWSDCDLDNSNWYGEYDALEQSILDSLVILNPNLEDYEYTDYINFNAGKVISIDLSTKGLFSFNLPSNFDSLLSLELLSIENNYLTEIPSLLCNLPEGSTVNMSKNRLCSEDINSNEGSCIDIIGHQYCSECSSGYWFEGYCLNENDIDFLDNLIDQNESLFGIDILNVGFEIPGLSNWEIGSLVRLDVSNNSITTLPNSIGNLKFLKELNLKNNLISNIPNSFAEMYSLEIIKLHNNKIEVLPDNFGNLYALQELYLPGNLLTSLPESIGELQSLNKLYLQNNYLLDLPISFCNLSSSCIANAKLDNNCLKGPFKCSVSTGFQNDCDSLNLDYTLLNRFELLNPQPNPFNSYVELSFSLSESGFVSLQIFDLKGRLIDSLINDWKDKGTYSNVWDANNYSSGIFLVKIGLNDHFKFKKMILLK